MLYDQTGAEAAIKRRLSILSALTGLSSLAALLCGVIPSIKFNYYDVSVGYFDIIQYVPEPEAIMAVVAMSAVIMTAVFAYISDVPRIVCVVLSALSLTAATVSAITLNVGVIYAKNGITAAEAGSGFNYGLKYGAGMAFFIIMLLAAVLLSCAAYITDQHMYDYRKTVHKKAEIKTPAVKKNESEKDAGFKNPGDF